VGGWRAGRKKGGKSLVQLALGAGMASGDGAVAGTVAGIIVKPAKVLLIDAENGRGEIHRRLRNLGLAPAYASRLVIVKARSIDLRQGLGQIKGQLDEHKPDLLLLDSFRSLWRGSEKDEEEFADALYPVSALAHERNIAISLTHHAKKDEDDTGARRPSARCRAGWCCCRVTARTPCAPSAVACRRRTPDRTGAP
jgi:RecA-family ATPase